MAISNGNSTSGSIGPIIHYMRNGKMCMRIKPAHVKNPRTKGQTNHRNKIKLAGELVKSLRRFIDIGYQATTLDMPMNEARQYIFRNCFSNDMQNAVLDYSKVLISRGDLAKPEETTLTMEGNTARITWKTPVKGDGRNGDDRVMIAAFEDENPKGIPLLFPKMAHRSDGACTISLPADNLRKHIWMFFYQPDYCTGESRMKISDSVYLS